MSAKCPHREHLLKESGTPWGQWHWERHVRRCAECAEMVRVEQEMTRLFERVGDWEETPEFIERVRRTLPTFDVPRYRLIARHLWQQLRISRPRTVGVTLALIVVAMTFGLNLFSRRPSAAGDAVFAAMMETLTAHRIFHTRGWVTRYDPTTGEMQTQIFNKWLKRVPDPQRLRWRQRIEINGGKEKLFFAEVTWDKDAINFPQAVYRSLKMTEKRVERSRLLDFSITDVKVKPLVTDARVERLLFGVPFLTRSAAEALANHPEAHIVMEPPAGTSQPSRLKVTLRDTQDSVLTCLFYLNPKESLPCRVEVSYQRGGRVRVTSTYTIEYPTWVSEDLFSAPPREER